MGTQLNDLNDLNDFDDFAGPLIRLRGLRMEDSAAFLAMDRDTDGARRWGETNLPRTDERSRIWLEEEVNRGRSDDTAFLVIERLQDAAVVGSVNVGRASARHGRFGYGLGIGREYRRRGYGAEAIKLLLRFYFGELRYRKSDTAIYSFNEASLHLHQKLGFTIEGRVREAIFTSREHFDEVLLGITATEFFDLHGG
jgi:RimJ/RimL family protein N-acetyltransferase